MCFGKHHMNASMDDLPEMCVPVDAIISHKDFVYPQISDLSNDVALVRLAKPMSMTREISPVCLPKPETLMPAGHFCYVTGWGDEKGLKILWNCHYYCKRNNKVVFNKAVFVLQAVFFLWWLRSWTKLLFLLSPMRLAVNQCTGGTVWDLRWSVQGTSHLMSLNLPARYVREQEEMNTHYMFSFEI